MKTGSVLVQTGAVFFWVRQHQAEVKVSLYKLQPNNDAECGKLFTMQMWKKKRIMHARLQGVRMNASVGSACRICAAKR